MDRFLKKTRVSYSSDEDLSTSHNSSGINETGTQSKPGKVRDYDDSYLAMGFFGLAILDVLSLSALFVEKGSRTLPWHQQN